MFLVKLVGKIFAIPLILVLAVLLGAVKMVVGIYSVARGLFSLLVGFLLVSIRDLVSGMAPDCIPISMRWNQHGSAYDWCTF